jgi:hypothetical protein
VGSEEKKRIRWRECEMKGKKKTKNQIRTQLGAMFLSFSLNFFRSHQRDFFSLARFHLGRANHMS